MTKDEYELIKKAHNALSKHYPYDWESGIIVSSLGYYMDALFTLKKLTKIIPDEESVCAGAMPYPPMKYDPELTNRKWQELSKEELFDICIEYTNKPFSMAIVISELLKKKNS